MATATPADGFVINVQQDIITNITEYTPYIFAPKNNALELRQAKNLKIEGDLVIDIPNLTVEGTLRASRFEGSIPGLDEKVSKAGDNIMTGSLVIKKDLTVGGTLKADKFEGAIHGLDEKVSKVGDNAMTGSLVIKKDLTVGGTLRVSRIEALIPGLADKVSKTGDIMTSPLTIENDLTVTGKVTAQSFDGPFPGLDEKISKAGGTMTGQLTIQNDLIVERKLTVRGDIDFKTQNSMLVLETLQVRCLQIQGDNGHRLTIQYDGYNWKFESEMNKAKGYMFLVSGNQNEAPGLYPTQPVELVATFFEHPNYQGRKLELPPGKHWENTVSKLGTHSISSVRMPQGLTAVLYSMAQFKGKTLKVNKDVADLRPLGFDNTTHCIEITEA